MKAATRHQPDPFHAVAEPSVVQRIPASANKPDHLVCQDELARVLSMILEWPIRAGTVGENYLPASLKQEADAALERWRGTR